MDANDLGSALMALGSFFQAANGVLNGDKARLSVRVEAKLEAGSFVVNLLLIQSMIAAKDFFLSQNVVAVDNLLQLVTGGPQVVGYFTAMRLFGGKKPVVVPPPTAPTEVSARIGPDEVELVADHARLVVKKGVFELLNSPEVRRDTARVMAPLERGRVDVFEARRPGGEVLLSQCD